MKESLQLALNNIEDTYDSVREIADDLLQTYIADVNRLVEYIGNNLENMTNDDVRLYVGKLSVKGFYLADVTEKAAIKAEIAESLKKEKYAEAFNQAEGSVAARENTSTLKISNEVVSEVIYDLVANTLKRKQDEIHRMVDSLKTILISRQGEAKLTASYAENIGGNENNVG